MKLDPTLHEPRVIENISPNPMKRTASFFGCGFFGIFAFTMVCLGRSPIFKLFSDQGWNFRISMDLNVSTLVKLHTRQLIFILACMQQVPSPKSPRLDVETFKYKIGIIQCLYVRFNICASFPTKFPLNFFNAPTLSCSSWKSSNTHTNSRTLR